MDYTSLSKLSGILNKTYAAITLLNSKCLSKWKQ
jgi:hypothetical protein